MDRLWRKRAHGWVAFAVFASACVKNPVTGTRELSLLSPEDEKRIGAQAARQIDESVGLVEDGELLRYVRQVGGALAQYSPRQAIDYRFDIVDMTEPNAFALPDGHVYISRGLLALSNTEDELAGVLGHEIGHVAARHTNQRFSRAAPVGILAGVTSAVVGIVSDDAARSVAGVGAGINAVLLAPHGRDQERQADRVGQDIAHRAGWNPEDLAHALESLGRMADHEHGKHEVSFLDSHPSTPERLHRTLTYAASLGTNRSRTSSRADHVKRLDGLLLSANASYGFFSERTFIHPELGFTVTFPEGWATAHSKKLAGAQAPDDDAIAVLGAQGPGKSPVEAAERFARLLEVTYDSGPSELTINEKPAARAHVSTGELDLTLTFIVHDAMVFQLLALTPPRARAKHAKALDEWAMSFDTASPETLASIDEIRVEVAPVEGSTTLAAILERYPSPLPASFIAILNGMASAEAPLPSTVLKVPVRVPYSARR